MEWMVLIETLIPAVAGPASAVIICVGVLVFIGYLVIKHVLPSIEKRFTESQANIDSLMTEHKADRETFHNAITALTAGQTSIATKMDNLIEEVKEIKDTVERIDADVDDILKARKPSTFRG